MSVRFSFPESWSSTPLAKKAVPGTAQDIFVLDNAFVLIEGQPLPLSRLYAFSFPFWKRQVV
jgi:hypothetical protein